mmetsp:Transcript_13899/g.32376  ORF Transcript_13899/g.32376 Transcript_13899/m.32376 type:complete len:168 (+) Transcript_13899:109-612(+)
MEFFSGILFPIGTIFLIVLVQISFWIPTENKEEKEQDEPRNRSKKEVGSFKIKGLPKQQPKERQKRTSQDIILSKHMLTKDFPLESGHCMVINDEISRKSTTLEASKQTKRNENANRNSPVNEQTVGSRRIWKCACEFGFLPAGILKTFGNAEAMMRLGVGQCYHKK